MQRGFSLISVIVAFLLIFVLGGIAYQVTNKQNQKVKETFQEGGVGRQTTPNPTISKDLDFETIKVKKFTDYSRTMTEPLVINNMDEWNKVVNQPEIGINFREETVLAAFFNATTGGYSIKISKISDKGDFIEVVVEQTSPGKGCLVTQATEFNSHLVKLQKITKTVKFKTENIMYDCID